MFFEISCIPEINSTLRLFINLNHHMIQFSKKALPVFLCLTIFSLSSCVKDVKENQEETQQAVEDIFLAQNNFKAGYDNMNDVASSEEDLNGYADDAEDRGCAVVSFETTSPGIFPAVLTLDFAGGCYYSGHNVSGALAATFDGFIFAEGKSMDIDFNAYVVDGYTLGGNYKLTNLGNNDNGQWQHNHTISNGSLTDPNGGKFTYVGDNTATMVEGQGTNWITDGLDGIMDDVWEEEGTATYVNAEGNQYTIVSLSPQRRPVNCEVPVSGMIEITSDNLNNPITVDFGDGTCDRKITVTVGILTFDMSI